MTKRVTSGEALSPAKQELLALLLKERQHEKRSAARQSIPRRAPADAYPLSFAQQRLWFLDQLVPNSPFYNIPAAIRLSGALDAGALARSLRRIVERHESLRTTFALHDGQPVQVIAPAISLPSSGIREGTPSNAKEDAADLSSGIREGTPSNAKEDVLFASLRASSRIGTGNDAPLRMSSRIGTTLSLLDLTGLPHDAREAAALRLAEADARRPFDLTRGPLVRAHLLRLAADKHVVLLNLHHIVADAWSMGALIRELVALYSAFAQGRPDPLPPLPIQYADYAVWQRAWLEDAEGAGRPAPLQSLLAYWKRQLGGDIPVLELPTDRPRPAFQTFNGAVQHWSLPAPLAEAITALSRREDVTLFMMLLAAFQALLFRYSGQRDIIVGSPIANRLRPEIKDLIGFFVNTLALRGDLSGDPRFRALLRRVQKVALEAYDHQDLPFEKLVEEIQPQRDPSRSPLFQVMFSLQNVPLPALDLPGLALRPLPLPSATARFDLIVTLEESAQGMSGRIAVEYNTDLFDAPTIARMLGHYQTLLAGIVAGPDQRLSELPLLSEAERQQLLLEWNATTVAYRDEECIHTLFEAQARRTPDAVAIVFDPATNDERRTTNDEGTDSSFIAHHPSSIVQLTYAELDRRANQLAHHLRGLGVQAGMRVGVSVERSVELIVGLLGILKAGAAYVPLDPASPPDRLAFMIADAETRVLLTMTNDQRPTTNDEGADSTFVLRPSSFVDQQTVDLRADWPMIARAPGEGLESRATAEHLGYVIYTSGSTGNPKGVAMSHRALVNLLYWQLDYLEHQVGTRFLQYASLSFDVSYQEIFPTLASGGAVVMIAEELRRDPPALWRLLFNQQVERIYLPYVGLQQLAEVGQSQGPRPTHLSTITVSGEQLQITRQIAGMFQRLGGSTLNNFYGPSESHAVTFYRLAGEPEHWPTLAPIGAPIANSQMYVLDRNMRPVPAGVLGELYIGGVCLADGYLHRPGLTAERFVPNPFVNCKLQIADCRLDDSSICNLQSAIYNRLYKTGDVARYRPDGAIMFLGRIDGQVKLRGYRIELEEIESVLRRHAQVKESVVLLREDAPGDKRLVAYIVQGSGVSGQGSEGSASEILIPDPRSLIPELRDFLKQTLPGYMIPSTFVVLDALPLTINGKVDRKALPAPDTARPELTSSFVEPRTAVEALLAGIIADVLRLERVGAEDNFFELGGHSLLAIQVVSRVGQVFRVTLPVRRIFEAPTVAALARALIAAEEQPGLTEKTAQIFQRIRQMSAEDRRQALQQRK